MTMDHIRSHGVRRLLIYCSTGFCHHSAVVDADRWPDDIVLLDLCRKAVCTRCGMDRRGRAPELERAAASGEPDRRTVAAAMKEIVLRASP
jgi:hypothetical protein